MRGRAERSSKSSRPHLPRRSTWRSRRRSCRRPEGPEGWPAPRSRHPRARRSPRSSNPTAGKTTGPSVTVPIPLFRPRPGRPDSARVAHCEWPEQRLACPRYYRAGWKREPRARLLEARARAARLPAGGHRCPSGSASSLTQLEDKHDAGGCSMGRARQGVPTPSTTGVAVPTTGWRHRARRRRGRVTGFSVRPEVPRMNQSMRSPRPAQ